MGTFRKIAFENILNRSKSRGECKIKSEISDFGCNVFSKSQMKNFIPQDVVKLIDDCILNGISISRENADVIASGMKAWAVSMNATHYTHWFQPLTGGTAEKHDAFLCVERDGSVLTKLSGNTLVQQEADASSFPSGGIRDTFEARGYSAWDPSSPAFIIDKTLCIPTIFISYTGEGLDFKSPLIKALFEIDKAATDVCQLIDKRISKVNANLGWEQEYFLVDEALFLARPDLVLTGRTLFGHEAAKGQQLEDHYFGSIPERVLAFMEEYENEAWKLGIPVKTRHNEVAPNQFELASEYEEANLSNDHNQLMMYLLKKTAKRHHFRVLFHEKPYAGVNGSGKHNNWSLSTDTGINLLSPGKNPKSHLLFITFLINTIAAFDDHADLLRAAVASSGNDFRLGANEAPPAIMSVFIGSYLELMLENFAKKVENKRFSAEQKTEIKLNIIKIPHILIDNTDRNRTSPFAFTGNKFEFRSVGSSDNCATGMIVLNTAVAAKLKQFKKDVDIMSDKGYEKDEAMYILLKKLYQSSKKRIYNGNGYSQQWIDDAVKRGLSNIDNTPEALKAYVSPQSISLFESNGILSKRELMARFDIKLEKYFKSVQIESRVMFELVKNHIVPSAIKYQNFLIENVKGLKELQTENVISGDLPQKKMINEITKHINELLILVDKMTEARKEANQLMPVFNRAKIYRDNVFVFFEKISYHANKLELLIDDEDWPLPKYREMLFLC